MSENPQTPVTKDPQKTATKLNEIRQQTHHQALQTATTLLAPIRDYIPAFCYERAFDDLVEFLMQSNGVFVDRALMVELEMRRKSDLSLDQVFVPAPVYPPGFDLSDPRN